METKTLEQLTAEVEHLKGELQQAQGYAEDLEKSLNKKDAKIKILTSGKMGRLFNYADAEEYSRLFWRVFMTYFGSEDCAKLNIQDRNLIVELHNTLDKYLSKKCKEQDIENDKRMRQSETKQRVV